MKNSGVIVKSCEEIDLTGFDVYRYGGCAKAYLDYKNKDIYKRYRENQTDDRRRLILGNFENLYKNIKKIDDLDFILPNTLYINENGLLEIQKMDYIVGICGINTIRKFYMNKKYYLILIRLINLIKKYTSRDFVIEDLKFSNIIYDENINLHIIDNDFTSLGEIPKEDIVKSFFVDEYLKKFGEKLTPDYNLFNLYFMVATLLLTPEEFKYAMDINRYPSKENLAAINYFIQKNNAIPQNFKNELKNLFSAQKEITFSEDIKHDICDFTIERIRKN